MRIPRGVAAGVVCSVALVVACSPHDRSGGDPDASGCYPGTIQCVGVDLQTCVDGVFTGTETCTSLCDPQLGCVLCEPGKAICLAQTSHVCNADGMGYTDTACTGPGEDCDDVSGGCEVPCSEQALANSYLGCEYFPTVTGNMVGNTFSYAIVIANYNGTTATATLDGAGYTPETFDIAPRSVVVKQLPWQQDLKLCNAPMYQMCEQPTRMSARANGGAYHITTTKPVAVYQFNPLDYENADGTDFSYTVDASLLFPVNVWGTEYRVASWAQSGGSPGLMTVVAAQDATSVTINTTAVTLGDATVPSFLVNQPQTLVLNKGDVVELGSIAQGDLSGSLVTSDKPVEVIGGHYCATVPVGTSYCDHLEESMIPVRALSADYVVVAPRNDTFPDGRIEVVRVMATEANTVIAYDPGQGGNLALANAGDFVDLVANSNNFVVTANHKILVAQYMEGQTATTGTADPAMTLAVPTGQYRSEYLFNAPTNYVSNYLDVIATNGTQLMLDGIPIAGTAEPIGTSVWNALRFTLDNGASGDGNHVITGTAPFGIQVYGFGDYTSYWYPGGLDLQTIVIQ